MIQNLKLIRDHWLSAFGFILIVVNFFVWSVVYQSSKNVLTVAFLDVGQGDAIFIESPTGHQVLVDAGSGRQVLRALRETIPFYDRSIDLAIATHPDADHIGGFPEVLKRYEVGMIIEPGVKSDTAVYQSFRAAAIREVGTTTLARRGMRINLDPATVGPTATLEILFPDQDPTGWETNTASIVARLTYGGSEFLFTGDSPVKIERYLVDLNPQNLQADVLKAGHHGSKTSSDPSFLAAVAPDYAIISAGKNNRYGHPHVSVLESLQKITARILRTDELGTIKFQTNGDALELCPC